MPRIPDNDDLDPGDRTYPGDGLQDDVFHGGQPWRVGHTLKRTVYHGDDFVGIMDTPALAALVVFAINRRLHEGGDD